MKIKDILEIESIIDKRAIPSDILEFLDQTYYSKSKDEHIYYGNMHIVHFLRVFLNKDYLEDMFNEIIKKHNQSVEDGSYYKRHPEIKKEVE